MNTNSLGMIETTGLLEGHSEPNLPSATGVVVKAGVFPTDIAEGILSAGFYNTAKPLFVEVRTALPLAEAKMGRIPGLDTVQNGGRICSRHTAVFLRRICIDIDLPADAAVVPALVGGTFEVGVIVRIYCAHNVLLRLILYKNINLRHNIVNQKALCTMHRALI